MTTLDDFIRQAIEAYLARTNMSAREFGLLALGDPSFVYRLKSGRALRLGTADRLLQFMDEAPIGPKFREEVEAFLSRAGMMGYKLGEEALGDPSFVQKLMSGASPELRTVDRVRSWMHGTQPSSGSETPDQGRPRETGASPQGDAPTFLSTRKAAALLTLSPRTLDRFRELGKGPPYFQLGQRIVYAREDLLEWAWSKRVSQES